MVHRALPNGAVACRSDYNEDRRIRRRCRPPVSCETCDLIWCTMAAKHKKSGHDDASELPRKDYEKELRRLQGELCHLQAWVKAKGLRVIVVFEGRDGAGKGGTIRAITERVSPRVFRTVALPAPSDREKSQMYMQRVHAALPGRRRGRDLRPQLVQPRRSRACDGLLQQGTVPAISRPVSRDRALHRRWRHPIAQILVRGQQRGTGTTVSGPDQRPHPTMEIEPDGSAVAISLV